MEFNRVTDFNPEMIEDIVVGDNRFLASILEPAMEGYELFTLSELGTVVAYALFGKCRGIREMSYMISAYVAKDYRQRGADRKLFANSVESLKREGYDAIYTMHNETSSFSTELLKKIKFIKEKPVYQLIYTNSKIRKLPFFNKIDSINAVARDVKGYEELSINERASFEGFRKKLNDVILGDDRSWEYSRYYVKDEKIHGYIPFIKSDRNCLVMTGFAAEFDPLAHNAIPAMILSVLKKAGENMDGDTSIILNIKNPKNLEACRKALGEPDEELVFSGFGMHFNS